MCGIIGYCGKKQAEGILIDGLHKLEYRGYDSVGIVCRGEIAAGRKDARRAAAERETGGDENGETGKFSVCKEVGKVADLARLCKEHSLQGHYGIGHCRWATHGAVNWNNAHPHLSSDKKVVLVHNGIIENYLQLKKFLMDKGYSFVSDSDTETVANLLAYFIASGNIFPPRESEIESETNTDARAGIGAPIDAGTRIDRMTGAETIYVRAVLALQQWLKGSYALGIMFEDCPHEMFAIRKESPLVVGMREQELFIASDIIPLAGYVDNIVYLNNHELAHLSYKDGHAEFMHYAPSGEKQQSKVLPLNMNLETVDKQGYAHFMLKEIYEQASIFAQMYSKYVGANDEQSGFVFDDLQNAILQDCNRIIFVSCGTSYHSSIYAAYLFEQYAHIACSVEYASEFRYRQPVLNERTLIVAISQSGETADTLAALQLAQLQGAKTLGIVNVATSSIARMVDILLCTDCGPEIGVASTKSYTAQKLLLFYLVLYVSEIREVLDKKSLFQMRAQSKLLPLLAEKILAQEQKIRELGRAYSGYQHMLFLGRGLFYPLALEGALKLKELSYIHAEGYAAAEMKHGPIALIDSNMPIVVCSPKHDVLHEKMQSNISEVKARGGKVFAIVSEGESVLDNCDDVFYVPVLSQMLDSILFALPLQLFAYHAALARGYNPDQPRNLAKSVTVE